MHGTVCHSSWLSLKIICANVQTTGRWSAFQIKCLKFVFESSVKHSTNAEGQVKIEIEIEILRSEDQVSI